MKTRLGTIAAALVLAAALTACGSNGENASAGNLNGSTEAGTATASEELVIKATNWEFDQQEYVIPKDTDVKLTLKTSGVHGIAISNTNVDLKGNKSTVVNLKAGTYEISCNIPCGTGHRNMKATLTVQ